VTELSVTATLTDQIPAVALDAPYDLSNIHPSERELFDLIRRGRPAGEPAAATG
jgi:hypothetical protein